MDAEGSALGRSNEYWSTHMRATLSALSTLSASLGQLVRRRDAARGEVEQGLQADEGAVTAEYAVVIKFR